MIDDFPAAVLLTIPIFSPGATSILNPLKIPGSSGRYLETTSLIPTHPSAGQCAFGFVSEISCGGSCSRFLA